MSSEAGRRRLMTTRRFESNAEADRHDLEFWSRMTPSERVLYAWRLSVEQWQLAGCPHEPGRCRSVARVIRGGADLGDIEGL